MRALGCTPDSPPKRARAKSSRLLLGQSPSYPVTCDNTGLEVMQLDQGNVGSCTGHGTSQRLQVSAAKQGITLPVVSPGDIYKLLLCLERVPNADGSLPALTDTGGMPADIVVAVNTWGVRPIGALVEGRNSDCSRANAFTEPQLADLERDAQTLLMGQYRIDESAGDVLAQTFAAIANQGAVGVGIFVDSAFERWDPGQPPLNDVNLSDPNGGGHWLCADRYDANAGVITLWNSWGLWGRKGHVDVTVAWWAKAVSDIYADRLQIVGRP